MSCFNGIYKFISDKIVREIIRWGIAVLITYANEQTNLY